MSAPAKMTGAAQAAPAERPPLTPRQRRQIVGLTLGAVALFIGLRFVPTGTNLSHMDFRVDAKNSIEFCDPLNPQFISVVAMRSPVQQSVTTPTPPVAGQEVRGVVVLRTANGKAIAPADLLVAHTRKLHLLIVDPSLTDYHHVHPEPAANLGEWSFAFTPKFGGVYRIFADFTPAATGRGLYAHADLTVGQVGASAGETRPAVPGNPAEGGMTAGKADPSVVERAGLRFALTPAAQSLRANQPIDLRFDVTRADGSAVVLAPVMGAFAHLVAFDEARSGFAHLHPMETDLARPPDGKHPVLNFKVTIPRGGRYVIWAQVQIDGREVFVPFSIRVAD